MNNYEAVLLIGLAGLGLSYIFGKSNWAAKQEAASSLSASG